MLTSRTKLTLALLHDIYQPNLCHIDYFQYSQEDITLLLQQLHQADLLTLTPGMPENIFTSYVLNKSYHEITLMDVLHATGEGLCFNHDNDPMFYARYGCLARKLGVMNHMVRLYLTEIHIFDFPTELPKGQTKIITI